MWQWRAIGILASASLLAGLLQPLHTVEVSAPTVVAQAPVTVTATVTVSASPLQAPLPPDPVVTKPPVKRPPKSSKPVNCAKLKCVALTMDDGPVGATAKVLSLLRKKHVHATFFVLGAQARAHPAIVRRMLADGNAVGNHSWNHPQFWHLSKSAIRHQLARTDAVLKRITGKRPVMVRPPYGEFNAKVRSVARAHGQELVLWDVDPQDWKDRKAKTVVKRVLKHARRGSIILTHDVWPSTRHAYGRIIDGLKARGFTLVTVPQLLHSKTSPGRVYSRS
jgi:peptidoglycan/xylan/chitin deacetylase (PgdA/CDA1 family)